MILRRAGLATITVLASMPIAASAAGAADPVLFAFAPVTDGNFVQREIYVETGRVGVIQKQVSMASESSLRISREAGRIFLWNRIERVAEARDGKPFDDPMIRAMTGAEIVHIVRPDGGLARIDGLRRLTERLLSTLHGEERGQLERRMRENRLEDRTRASWFDATEILAGQTLDLDRDYFFDSAWPTDEGWIRHQTLVRLGPWEATPRGRLLRVKSAYVADARAAVPSAGRLQPRIHTAFKPALPGPIAKGYTLVGNASRLVDPATMTIWRDQSSRQIRTQMRMSEEMSVTVSTEESTDITLESAPGTLPAKPPSNSPVKPPSN